MQYISGVERQPDACFWRSAPALPQCAFLASERQDAACFWRSTPDAPYWRLNASKILLQGVIFLLLFFILFLIFLIYFVTPHDHEPNKT